MRRGSIIFWVDEEAVQSWRDSGAPGPLAGRRRTYSGTAIECVMAVRAVSHLSLRESQGFLESVVKPMGVDLPIPGYTTVSRRQAGLALELGSSRTRTPRHVVIDTTG